MFPPAVRILAKRNGKLCERLTALLNEAIAEQASSDQESANGEQDVALLSKTTEKPSDSRTPARNGQCTVPIDKRVMRLRKENLSGLVTTERHAGLNDRRPRCPGPWIRIRSNSEPMNWRPMSPLNPDYTEEDAFRRLSLPPILPRRLSVAVGDSEQSAASAIRNGKRPIYSSTNPRAASLVNVRNEERHSSPTARPTAAASSAGPLIGESAVGSGLRDRTESETTSNKRRSVHFSLPQPDEKQNRVAPNTLTKKLSRSNLRNLRDGWLCGSKTRSMGDLRKKQEDDARPDKA